MAFIQAFQFVEAFGYPTGDFVETQMASLLLHNQFLS